MPHDFDDALQRSYTLWDSQTDLPQLLGHWRGIGELQDFDPLQHPCVVLVEYARHALSRNGSDSDVSRLKSTCEKLLSVPEPLSRLYGPIWTMMQAITNTVLAALYWKSAKPDDAAKCLFEAINDYNDHRSTVPETIEASNTLVEGKRSPLIDLMAHASSRPSGREVKIQISTWLALDRLLCRIFGAPEMAEEWSNTLRMLTISGRYRGKVINTQFDRVGASISGAYFDPLSFGVTSIREKMLDSIQLAWRCCHKYTSAKKPRAIRIQAKLPFACTDLGGDSAGGLFAAGAIATMRDQKLDRQFSATCRLVPPSNGKEWKSESVKIEGIRGLAPKIAAAWQLEHGINGFFVSAEDAELWRVANPGRTVPSVDGVQRLSQLLDGLHGDCRFEDQLERHATWVHGQWGRIENGDEKESERSVNQEHRFEFYVDPDFRIEGPKPKVSRQLEDEESGLIEPRGPSLIERETFPVPGTAEDEQLTKILKFAFGKDEFGDRPKWLKPKESIVIYDNAGAGKTVCSYRIRRLLTDRNLRVQFFGKIENPPLVVRLDGYWRRTQNTRGKPLDLRQLLIAVFAEETNQLGEDRKKDVERTVNYALQEKRVVLILDGFDQFPHDDRKWVSDIINKQRYDNSGCRWIVTSRVHAIDEWRDRNELFQDDSWMRVRIEPFSEEKQDRYFAIPSKGRPPIGDRWLQMVDRGSMAELLGLPMVLWLLRTLIETIDEEQEESGETRSLLPRFTGLSQLYLIATRWLLRRALQKNEKAVTEKLKEKNIAPHVGEMSEKVKDLEHVLTLLAFQMMLMEEYNGQRVGKDQVKRFLHACETRYTKNERERIEQASEEVRAITEEERKAILHRWTWALAVLQTIELEHRSVTEVMRGECIAFRSRKMVECHAARYLTQYASHRDVFADGKIEDTLIVVDPLDDEQIPSRLCAWNYTTHPDWDATWELAIGMPNEVISISDQHGIFVGAIRDDAVTCESLSALFKLPKPYPRRDIRPTKLMYLAWHLFEVDERLASEYRFVDGRETVKGTDIIERQGKARFLRKAELKLLGGQNRKSKIITKRNAVLSEFRSSNKNLVDAIQARLDRSISPLSEWQEQTSLEKSLTFLQCPPEAWIKEYESTGVGQDPRINPAIEGHESEQVGRFKMQATTVTRAMYRAFDPCFELTERETWDDEAIRDEINARAARFETHTSDDDFPIICVDWFDSWVFCKWLGSEYRLPSEFEWEHACRAGTETEYHFGKGLNGTQANCNGNYPHGTDDQGNELGNGPYLECTTPVGCGDYPCNAYGLFDVHGNVWEWCQNCSDETDSSPWLSGGSWRYEPGHCRSSYRLGTDPDGRGNNIGFRVCRE